MTPLVLLVVSSAYELGTGVGPVEKVIAMMQDMAAKGQAAKEAEAVQQGEYMKWCKDTSRMKSLAIRDAKLVIEKQSAAAQKAQADSDRLADEIAALEAQRASWSADKKAATDVRQKEAADFKVVHDDYTASINAMDRAVSTLTSKAAGAIGAFMQMSKAFPHRAQAKIQAFLEKDEEIQPAGNAYEFHADGLIAMVKDLQAKMQDERAAEEKEEAEKRFAFQKLEQQLSMDIASATDDRDSKAELKAQRLEDAAAATSDVLESSAAKAADETYLSDLTAQCSQKATDFTARQEVRQEELGAIAKAIEIMSGDGVSGGTAHLPALLQRKRSLAMLRSTGSGPSARVAVFLEGRARKADSRLLSQLALKIKSGLAGPFDKVKKMIENLLDKLAKEAAEEADHKAWCDTELTTNKHTRDEKTEAVNRLTAQNEKLTAEIQLLGNEIAALEEEISDVNAALKQATDQRVKEKAENESTVKDAKAAIVAVQRATSVLKQFYAKAAEATALVQGPADDAPVSFTAPYRGMGGSSTGVVGMLEVILSDFSRLEAETSSTESEAQSAFDKFSSDTGADIKAMNVAVTDKGRLKTKAEKNLNEVKKDIKSTQEELDGALEYYDKLKPSCLDAGVSYSDRVQRREEELESLKEALKILGSDE
jgi:hypothetical protein